MRLVIDISDYYYQHLKDNESFIRELNEDPRGGSIGLLRAYLAILDGAPIPKGHGRLIDAKEAEKKMAVTLDEDIGSQSVARYILRTPSETPTIIEADKAESEEK